MQNSKSDRRTNKQSNNQTKWSRQEIRVVKLSNPNNRRSKE